MFAVVEFLSPLFFFSIPLFLIFFIAKKPKVTGKIQTQSPNTTPYRSGSFVFPKSYPFIGSYLAIIKNRNRFAQWTADLLHNSPSGNFFLHRSFGNCTIFTANPANVERVLKTRFDVYKKGVAFRRDLHDLLGDGIINADDENWRFQRQIAIHEFTTRSLRKFVETVVESEISDRLIPFLSGAAAARSAADLQDVLQRFAFDNICKIAFGFDPEYLSPSLPAARFAEAFEDGVRISSERLKSMHHVLWKAKRFLRIGSERRLRIAASEVREFARFVVREKKKSLDLKSELGSVDLLSRFLKSGHSNEDLAVDFVVSFIIGGRDTTSAALIWFFFLISRNPKSEAEIWKEIGENSESEVSWFESVNRMVYTHAALCESMRLYPPVPMDSKEAQKDDVWDDGTVVKKGTRVTYHPYAMGRSEKLWGRDWEEYLPERWLRREDGDGRWRFVARDAYAYPVFQAGPRLCVGRDMAFLQMKMIVAGIMRRFRVVPTARDAGADPVYLSGLTSKMKGGFPVFIEERKGLS